MLKWTASAQKLMQHSSSGTPQQLAAATRRRQRRATIANKENIPYTSTPMVARERNSPLVLAPLTDLLNITPESSSLTHTPERRSIGLRHATTAPLNRRHSTLGLSIATAAPQYASTLPRYEEEYSPSTVLPSGQQLALRGLLPDPFVGKPRYFTTPEVAQEQSVVKVLPQKRKLEQEFAEIAQQCADHNKPTTASNVTVLSSARMGDQTLDKLIDAILDSARKHEKRKKPRRSFNLRRRTLLKNQAVMDSGESLLSPTYTAADDPASDLSFLLVEKQAPVSGMPRTPAPATPPPGTPIPEAVLQQLPTPKPALHFLRSASKLDNTFSLETPVRRSASEKQRQSASEKQTMASETKRFKLEARSYFEIGLELPSIYV